MRDNSILITFSQLKSSYRKNGNELIKSAIKVGFDKAYNFSEKDIKDKKITKKIKEFRKIGTRGYGYYIWKPYIILEALKNFKCDFVFYHDAGRQYNISYKLNNYPDKIIEHIKKYKLNFFLGQQVPQHGNLSKWTKRDCFTIMNMDKKNIYLKPQIQGGWSVWKNTPDSIRFLKEWLKYCSDIRCITDQENVLNKENLSDFIVHRYDMSIFTLLAYKKKLNKKYYFNFSNMIVFKIFVVFLNKIKNPNFISCNFLKMMDDTELVLKKKYWQLSTKWFSAYINKLLN